jgi:hypothetical protein
VKLLHQTASVVFPLPDSVPRVHGLTNLVKARWHVAVFSGYELTVWGILSFYTLRTAAQPTRRLVPEADGFRPTVTIITLGAESSTRSTRTWELGIVGKCTGVFMRYIRNPNGENFPSLVLC